MISAQNAYPKDRVIKACDETLMAIGLHRDKLKDHHTIGKKTIFGRQLTVEEAWERVDKLEKMLIETTYKEQENAIRRIKTAANNCLGHMINLTNDEFSLISQNWK